MPADLGPGAVVGWLRAHDTADGLAGCAFLIGPDIVLTCAHVIAAHLGLTRPAPAQRPTGAITVRFEALQSEVAGHIIQNGWFTNERRQPSDLSDIAVIRLDQPVTDIAPLPAIAQRMPAETRIVLIHGAEADYRSYGQQVQGEMGGSNIPRGWRQIDPKSAARGFTVAAGFSGSPVLDDLGNVVWGMIVAVAETGTGVAYAIPADHLWRALKSSGAETTVRTSDAADQRAAEAMAKLRADYEAKLAERDSETGRTRQELDQLRQTVRTLEQDARESPGDEAATALAALAEGDTLPATESLRRKLDERLDDAATARRDAANLARQLGAMLKLTDAPGALAAYRQAAECDPDDHQTWIEVGRLEQLAGTLDGAEKVAVAALRAAKDERSRGVALNALGDVRLAKGDLAEALASYEAWFKIAERLAEADPGNADAQRDLSISHNRIAGAKRAQGDLTGALASCQAGFKIAERLAKSDPANTDAQRDLSISNNRTGDVKKAKGDLTGALASYEAGFTIAERLAGSDPGNPEWLRDLSVSYEKLGDVKQAKGDLTGALASYQAGFAIRKCLAEADPGNSSLQFDLSISYHNIGEVMQAQRGLPEALTSYQAALAIRARLAEADPRNTGWQRALAFSFGRLGDIQAHLGETAKAIDAMRQARDIVSYLAKEYRADANLRNDLSWYRRQITNLEARST